LDGLGTVRRLFCRGGESFLRGGRRRHVHQDTDWTFRRPSRHPASGGWGQPHPQDAGFRGRGGL